jgi:hypothetical protein
VDDERQDEAPKDAEFYERINDRVAGKTGAKRKASAIAADDAEAEEQLLQETQEREDFNVAQESGGDEEDVDAELHQGSDGVSSEDEDEEVEEQQREGGEQAEESPGRDDADADNVRGTADRADGSTAPGSSVRLDEMEYIARVEVISADMEYIEPEHPDTYASTFFLNCDKLNNMIKLMGKKGWINQKGDWEAKLLQTGEEPGSEEEEAEHPVENEDCTKLFQEIDALRKNCIEMTKASDLEEQASFLRSNSQRIRGTLEAVKSLTERVHKNAPEPEQGKKKLPKNAQRKRQELLTWIYIKLIPALVLTLKEALLLGGYSRMDTKPETISNLNGQFMACTLQFPLRIIGFMDQLYSVVSTQDEMHMKLGLRKNRVAFARYLGELEILILKGMNELKRMAQAPMRAAELEEQARRERKLHLRRERLAREARERQMRMFIASTHRLSQGYRQPSQDAYYNKHGWRLQEDEALLGVIRKTRSPNMLVLATLVPHRTVNEVMHRMGELREMMKAKFEKGGLPPPKWCYY